MTGLLSSYLLSGDATQDFLFNSSRSSKISPFLEVSKIHSNIIDREPTCITVFRKFTTMRKLFVLRDSFENRTQCCDVWFLNAQKSLKSLMSKQLSKNSSLFTRNVCTFRSYDDFKIFPTLCQKIQFFSGGIQKYFYHRLLNG